MRNTGINGPSNRHANTSWARGVPTRLGASDSPDVRAPTHPESIRNGVHVVPSANNPASTPSRGAVAVHVRNAAAVERH